MPPAAEPVAERDHAPVSSRQTADRLRTAISHARMMVYHTDRDLRYRWIINPHPGFAPDEVLGRRDDEFLPPEQAAPLIALKQSVLRNGAGRREAITLHTRLGEQTWDFSVDPLRDAGGAITGLSVTAFEVTERKEKEDQLRLANQRLRQVNDDLEQFTYIASHDLRAPLRGVKALAGWISEELEGHEISDGVRRRLDLLVGRIQRMEALLADLLAYARTGQGEGEIEEVELCALVREVVETSDLPSGFTVRCASHPPVFHTHRTPLETVLRNLIANAIKHHDRDTGEIVVDAAPGAGMVVFAVADDGPGIDPKFRERVFRMFTTLKPRDKVEGSGMGLAIVKRIVALRGGHVWLEPRPDARGTMVKFAWPLGAVE